MGGQVQGKGLQTEGKEVYRHIVPVKGKNEEVNRQCHSRNRTKYIYINSLLYNHDKQQQKKTFTQKYKFEIINSTSVSDNSFFPPATQSTKLHSVKGDIYESQRWVGRRKALWGRESSYCDLERKPQS